jgi:GMP synthase-like glutamine amidotransferase
MNPSNYISPNFNPVSQPIRVALLDLYDGAENQGMRCIRAILAEYSQTKQLNIVTQEFDVRRKMEVPGLEFDLYISSGGPGSPLESEGSEWEKNYFNWLEQTLIYNRNNSLQQKKHVLFICHSFQLACRYFEVGKVVKRKSTAFGIFPVHLLEEAQNEPVLKGLKDPFYSVDSRDYQVIQPRHDRIQEMGATLLCIEKERPHVPLERAVMGIRFNPYMIGTQFHPEADAEGMTMYLTREDKKKTVIENYGQAKWENMLEHLNDPDKIRHTYAQLLPNFLDLATGKTG